MKENFLLSSKNSQIVSSFNPFVPRKGFKRTRGSNLTQDEIKKRILINLYEKGSGLNQNQIRAIPTLNSVEWNALGSILAELCVVGKLNADPPSDYKEGAWMYSITDDGREFIELIKKMRGLGGGFSFFDENTS
jgi:predicted transcriptional regulator